MAGNTVNLQSGADTTIAGATVTAPTVHAQVGGNLNIESRQDTSSYESQQKSAGAGVSLCIPPLCYGASSVSGSAAAQNIESTLKSVGEQSGIRAGDGGFTVNVKDNTTLTGGAITSTDKAVNEGKNSFQTGGTLSTTDVQNEAHYQGDGFAASITVAGGGKEKPPEGQETRTQTTAPKTSGSAGMGEDSGTTSSVTTAGISGIAGDKDKRTGDAEQGIAPIFDKDKVQKEIDAQIKITQEFGQQASTAWGEYANQKFVDAVAAGDAEGQTCWGPSGACRAGGHAVLGGLTGGVAGAAGAATSSLTAPAFNSLLTELGVPEAMATGLTTAYAAGIGGLVGGTSGAVGGANEAINNNALAARVILMTVEAGGAGLAQACLKSARCIAAVGTTGVVVLNGILEAANENGGKGPMLGDVNPNVFGGSESALPADTYGTPPNGASPPPEDDSKEKNRAKDVDLSGVERHSGSRLADEGISTQEAKNAVLSDIERRSADGSLNVITNRSASYRTIVNGKEIEYRIFRLPDGRLNVGTIFPVK